MNINHFTEWAHTCLLESDEAKEYLLSRGVSEIQWSRNSIGFTGGNFIPDPKEDSAHNELCGDKEQKGKWCDTCRYIRWSSKWVKETDSEGRERMKMYPGGRILNSIVLPLSTYHGADIGFQTRSITEKNYDTFALSKRPEGYFFGVKAAVDAIWAKKAVFLTEGPFDHLILNRLVAPNSLSITTSSPGKQQIAFINRFVDTIYSCFDMDKAGNEGYYALERTFGSTKTLVKIDYPRVKSGDKDLGDFWKRVGDNKFRSYFHEKLGLEK